MLLNQTMKLLEEYGRCPGCGSQKLGNDEGSLEIQEQLFIRNCKCGFFVVVRLGEEDK